MSLQEFFDMGGYGVYVWSSYGIAALVLLANVLFPILERRRLMAQLARRARRERQQS